MDTIRQHWKLYLTEGILMMIIGFLAVILPVLSTLSIELIIGWLFVIGGAMQIIRTFQAGDEAPAFWMSLLSGAVSIVVGVLLLLYPLTGMLTLTILLTIFFILEGIIKLGIAWQWRHVRNWGWLTLSGLLALVMAAIIIMGWPATATWVIGLLVGINLIFFGWALIAMSLTLKPPKQA